MRGWPPLHHDVLAESDPLCAQPLCFVVLCAEVWPGWLACAQADVLGRRQFQLQELLLLLVLWACSLQR